MLRNGRFQPRESSGRLGNERKEVKIMKHINLKLQKLEERIAPGGCGCGTRGSQCSKSGSNKGHAPEGHGLHVNPPPPSYQNPANPPTPTSTLNPSAQPQTKGRAAA